MTTILDEILAERVRQHRLWGDQSHLPLGTDPAYTLQADSARANYEEAARVGCLTFADIITEEFWELLAATTDEDIRAEAIQVAAVCVQIIEAIDQRQEGAAC